MPDIDMFTDTDASTIDPADVDWEATAERLQQQVTRLGAERDALSEMLRGMAGRVWREREAVENLWIALQDAWADIDAARHARHGAWRRWRLVHRATGWAYLLGLIAGRGFGSSRSCRGCLTFIALRGPRPYILARRREWWSCLIMGRHLRRETSLDEGGICTVCAPCWTCGSPDPGHTVWACGADRTAVGS